MTIEKLFEMNLQSAVFIVLLTKLLCLFNLAEAQFYFGSNLNTVPNYGRCQTPHFEPALCIQLSDCHYLYGLLESIELQESEKIYMRRSQCGFINGNVLICCPDRFRKPFVVAEQPIRPPSSQGISLLPLPGQCGNVLSNRIYGGNATSIDEFPWMALLEYKKPGGFKGHHCGGSLINNRYVVTAAHCIKAKALPTGWRLSSVRLGEWDTTTKPDCEVDRRGIKDCAPQHLDVGVELSVPHPNYIPNSRNQLNDIALVRLSRAIEFTAFVRPICLPLDRELRSSSLDGIALEVAGWGRTEQGSASTKKLKASVEGVNLDECRDVYKERNIDLDDTQMCAGGAEGVDSCHGDSGGPLIGLDVTSNKQVNYFLAGVVSFGPESCGLEGWPGVYTRVGDYVNWIQQTIRE